MINDISSLYASTVYSIWIYFVGNKMTESHPDNSNQRKRKSDDADEVGLYSHHSVTSACTLIALFIR